MTVQQKNKKVLLITLCCVGLMIGLAFASVPLYRAFCQVTGYGGSTQKVVGADILRKVFDRKVTVQFNADVNPHLPWDFKPDLREVSVKVGQDALISYSAHNKSDKPVTGTAVYNVTPLKVGKYFNKVQCFCFGEQLLNPNEQVQMPVTFFIDPDFMDDPEMKDVNTITLSYTFFRHSSSEWKEAVEKLYNEDSAVLSAPKT